MSIDLLEFFQRTDPSRTLQVNQGLDKKYYIDFSSVRGGDIIGTICSLSLSRLFIEIV